jgi:hypothetical protein
MPIITPLGNQMSNSMSHSLGSMGGVNSMGQMNMMGGLNNPLATPMKGQKVEEGSKARWQTVTTIE